MHPDELTGLFDDLEQRAEGLARVVRRQDAADLARSEYAEVDFAARLFASVGTGVTLDLVGLGRLQGTLVRAGRDCLLVTSGATSWLVSASCLLSVRGLTSRAVPSEMRPVTARLGMASALRSWAEHSARVHAVLRDGSGHAGVLARVGSDFIELVTDEGTSEVVPLAMVAAVRPR